MHNGNTVLTPLVETPQVTGAGGWMTWVEASSDGTLLGRCDTTVAHRLDPGATSWVKELIPGSSLLAADVNIFGTPGNPLGAATWAAAISWSNSAVRAVACMGYIFIKKTGASNYTKSALPKRLSLGGNDGSRMNGQPLQFDPANPNVLIAALPDGVFISSDQGDNWTGIPASTIPLPSSTIYKSIVRFDRSSAVTGGKTQVIYIFIAGSGVYKSTNGGTSWALMSGSPTSAGDMRIHPTTGKLIIAGANTEADGPVNVWNGTAWSVGVRTGGSALNLHSIEFDPNVANKIYGIQTGGAFSVSTDGGANWGDYSPVSQSSSTVDIVWHVSDSGYRSIGSMAFQPVSGSLFISAGVGCWEMKAPLPSATNFNITLPWYGHSRGIENMVTTTATVAPDGRRGLTMQDKQSMLFDVRQSGRSFTNHYGPRVGSILRGQVTDYAPEDTNFWVTTFVDGVDGHLGYTPDLGKTWTEVKNLKALTGGNGGGQVVVLSKDIVIAAQLVTFSTTGTAKLDSTVRTKNALYITRNFRATTPTWTEIVIGNGNAVMAQASSDHVRVSMCKDPYVPGRVYFYNPGDVEYPNSADTVACVGFYQIDVDLTTATAPTVTRKRTTRFSQWGFGKDYYHMKVRHGGAANTVLICGGGAAMGAYRSTDGGANWTELTGTDNLGLGTRFGEVFGIAAGKRRNDSSPPTIYVAGFRITADYYYDGSDFSKLGLWASYDNGLTWTFLEQFPGQVIPGGLNCVNDINASMASFGDVTITTDGKGAVQRYYDYQLRAV